VAFALHVRNDNRDGTPPQVRLKAVSGPGDDGEPVVVPFARLGCLREFRNVFFVTKYDNCGVKRGGRCTPAEAQPAAQKSAPPALPQRAGAAGDVAVKHSDGRQGARLLPDPISCLHSARVSASMTWFSGPFVRGGCPVTRLASLLCVVLVAPLAFAITGCLDFERQTVIVAFPKDNKEVRCLFLYEGLHVGRPVEEAELNGAKEALAKLVNDEDSFYLFNNTSLVRQKGVNAGDDAEKWTAFLQKRLTIRSGACFYDEPGLCFYQIVTIKDAKNFVAEINPLIGKSMGSAAEWVLADERLLPQGWDAETMRLIKKAAGDTKYTWFQMEPGRVTFTIPATPASRKQMRLEVRDSHLFNAEQLSFDEPQDRLTIAIGLGGGDTIRVAGRLDGQFGRYMRDRLYDRELHAAARKLKAYEKEPTVEKVIADFLKKNAPMKKPE
jgi:hypothetical protein